MEGKFTTKMTFKPIPLWKVYKQNYLNKTQFFSYLLIHIYVCNIHNMNVF